MVDPTLAQRLSECGRAIAMATVPAMGTTGTVNVPTTIAACARMAGTYLFRSFNLQAGAASPGDVVLSQEAAANTPALLQTCAGVLKGLAPYSRDGIPEPAMTDPVEPLVLDLLEWIGPRAKPYSEVIEVWRTSCPRLPVWEEANARGFVARLHKSGTPAEVVLTRTGLAYLQTTRQ